MIIHILYLLEIIILLAAEGSLAGILVTGKGSIPVVLLSASVCWILLRGFRRGWVLTALLLGIYFIVVMPGSGMSALYTLLAVYGASYLSRRYLFEHRGAGRVMVAAYVGGVSALGVVLLPLLLGIRGMMEGAPFLGPLGWNLGVMFLVGAAAYLVLFPFLRITGRVARAYRDRESLGRVRV